MSYDARGFGNAEELYTALVEEGQIPDLLVLDQRLPDEFGSTILHSLRERPQYRDIPVLFVTAIDDEEAERLADLAPVVRKPFDFVDFVDAVRASSRPQRPISRSAASARRRVLARRASRYALGHRDGGAPRHPMIRTTPFHDRTSALNETGLWQHWSGHVVVTRYQASDKFEYFAVRNSAGIFDTSPLYKYRIAGRDAERFLSGMLARDIRRCPPWNAQYTTWLDDRGFVLEDGVIQHRGSDEFLLTAAEPNFAWFADRVGRLAVTVEEVSLDIGTLAVQGPRSRDLLARLVPSVSRAALLRHHHRHHRRAGRDGEPHRLHRRPRLRDLGRGAGRVDRVGRRQRCGRWPRHAAVRHGGAVHAAHRGRAAAPGRRLRLQPVRLQRRPSVHSAGARLGMDVQGVGGGRPPVHRTQGAGARARGEDAHAGGWSGWSSTGRTTTGSTAQPA